MSETKKKRVNKTKEEIVETMIDNDLKKFKEEIQALEVKYGYRLEPVMYHSKMGSFPQIEVQKIKKDESVKTEETVV